MDGEVETIRVLSDDYLMKTVLGGAFVDVYYRLSPGAADYIAEYSLARSLVRIVLNPVVWMTELLLAVPGLLMGIFAAFGVLFFLNRRTGRAF